MKYKIDSTSTVDQLHTYKRRNIMFLQTLLLISSLSFAADGSKYKGKTGREAHESVKEPNSETPSGRAPTPVTPTNTDKQTDNASSNTEAPAEVPQNTENNPENTQNTEKNGKNRKNRKNGKNGNNGNGNKKKSDGNTMLYVGGGALVLGGILLALLMGKKKEE